MTENRVASAGSSVGSGIGSASGIGESGPGGLVWADLSEETIAKIDATPDPSEKIKILNETMGMRHYHDNPRSKILVDFCLYNIIFCDENAFSVHKKSAFFSIMKTVFVHAFESPAPVSREDSLQFFRQRVLEHSVNEPGAGRVGVFTLPDIKLMTGFVTRTFFRNFSAYRICFSTRQPVESETRHLAVETPMTPMPLWEGELVGDEVSY